MENSHPTPPSRSILAKIFISPDERRLRAGWRLLLHMFILWVLTLTFSAGLGFFFVTGGASPSQEVLLVMGQITSALAITLSVYIARGYLDQRSMASLGLYWNRQAVLDLAAGVVITLLAFAFIFFLLLAAGWVEVSGFGWQDRGISIWINQMLAYFFVFLLAAWQEELLARGYWLQNLADGLNLFWGVILSSAIFSLLHLINPGSSLVSSAGLFIAGLFLAFGYLTTRRLWLPIGLHLGWNLFEGPLFGLAVSGVETASVIDSTLTGPEWITGGAFGPEAGVILLPGLLLGVFLIVVYSRWAAARPQPAQEETTAERQP